MEAEYWESKARQARRRIEKPSAGSLVCAFAQSPPTHLARGYDLQAVDLAGVHVIGAVFRHNVHVAQSFLHSCWSASLSRSTSAMIVIHSAMPYAPTRASWGVMPAAMPAAMSRSIQSCNDWDPWPLLLAAS